LVTSKLVRPSGRPVIVGSGRRR